MGWFQKKKNPASERERALRAEIARLEGQIQGLATSGTMPQARTERPPSAQPNKPQPKLRSTALPGGVHLPKVAGPTPPHPPREQIFEKVDHKRLETPPEKASKALYNELGVRKYDLPGAWQRLLGLFKGNTAKNQTFVKLLAAGNIQGLRTLRYEKRVARRRFVVFVVVLFLLLWGIIAMFIRR